TWCDESHSPINWLGPAAQAHVACVSSRLPQSLSVPARLSGAGRRRGWPDVATLRHAVLDAKTPRVPVILRAAEFACYSVAAMFVHATIAVPAVITRVITDMLLGHTFFQAVAPVRRADLY